MIVFGVKEVTLHEGYLTSCKCEHCGKEEENLVRIYASAFVLGPWLFPIKWFCWGKKADVTCQHCNRTLSLAETTGHLRVRFQQLFKETNIPFYYWLPGAFVAFMIAINLLSALYSFGKDLIVPTETKLTGVWDFKASDELSKNLEQLPFELPMNDKGKLFLYGEHTYTLFVNDSVAGMGTWQLNPESKVLSLSGNEFRMEDLTLEKLRLKSLGSNSVDALIHAKVPLACDSNGIYFTKEEKSLSEFDPYQPKFNQWRIVATSPETVGQIKRRVDNHLEFLEKNFEDAIATKKEFCDREKASPLVLAANGVALKPDIEDWEKTFFSETDVATALDMLKRAFPKELDLDDKNRFKSYLDFLKLYRKNLAAL